MAEENAVQKDTDSERQNVSTASQDSDVDYKDLYNKEISNAKRQRQKKQDAEVRLAELEKLQDESRKLKLQEDGEYKVLIKELEQKLTDIEVENKVYREQEDNEKKSLLERFPDEDRDQLSNLDLATLKYIDKKANAVRAENPPDVPGAITGKEYDLAGIDKLSPKERQSAWGSLLKQYEAKNKMVRS